MTSRENLAEIASWLRQHVPPVSHASFGPSYRASAYLSDGTFLPCVNFRNPKHTVDLAIRRFEQTQSDPKNYRSIVQSFTTAGNRLAEWDITRVEKSRFAIPAPLRERLYLAGETSMSWTSFIGKMADGTEHSFGSAFHVEFFQMPGDYTAEQLTEVFPHRDGNGKCFRELPFFECALDGL